MRLVAILRHVLSQLSDPLFVAAVAIITAIMVGAFVLQWLLRLVA
jgi:undecaprenyl pyrophosphate phosphatase UppP